MTADKAMEAFMEMAETERFEAMWKMLQDLQTENRRIQDENAQMKEQHEKDMGSITLSMARLQARDNKVQEDDKVTTSPKAPRDGEKIHKSFTKYAENMIADLTTAFESHKTIFVGAAKQMHEAYECLKIMRFIEDEPEWIVGNDNITPSKLFKTIEQDENLIREWRAPLSRVKKAVGSWLLVRHQERLTEDEVTEFRRETDSNG